MFRGIFFVNITNMSGKNIVINSAEEKALRSELELRHDPESERIKRFLAMPDLSRTPGSPLKEIVDLIKQSTTFREFDDINIPEIVPTHVLFDLFGFAQDHPARSPSDTYYVDEKNVLRPHDTVMWYYYFTHPAIRERIARGEPLGVVCYGKVYRKDEIDRHHMNIFHQFGAIFVVPDSQKTLNFDDLKKILVEVVENIFGKGIKYRFNPETFPYTDPSIEIEIEVNGIWVEMVGSGMARKDILTNFGLTGYHGWAFGFGLERLAIASMTLPDIRLLWSQDERVKKQLRLGNTYKEVSKFPPITRDISFVITSDFIPNNYFDLIRDIGGDLIEEVSLIDKYEDMKKFGEGKISYTYRIIYRSNERTLEAREIDPIQEKIYSETAKQFNAELR